MMSGESAWNALLHPSSQLSLQNWDWEGNDGEQELPSTVDMDAIKDGGPWNPVAPHNEVNTVNLDDDSYSEDDSSGGSDESDTLSDSNSDTDNDSSDSESNSDWSSDHSEQTFAIRETNFDEGGLKLKISMKIPKKDDLEKNKINKVRQQQQQQQEQHNVNAKDSLQSNDNTDFSIEPLVPDCSAIQNQQHACHTMKESSSSLLKSQNQNVTDVNENTNQTHQFSLHQKEQPLQEINQEDLAAILPDQNQEDIPFDGFEDVESGRLVSKAIERMTLNADSDSNDRQLVPVYSSSLLQQFVEKTALLSEPRKRRSKVLKKNKDPEYNSLSNVSPDSGIQSVNNSPLHPLHPVSPTLTNTHVTVPIVGTSHKPSSDDSCAVQTTTNEQLRSPLINEENTTSHKKRGRPIRSTNVLSQPPQSRGPGRPKKLETNGKSVNKDDNITVQSQKKEKNKKDKVSLSQCQVIGDESAYEKKEVYLKDKQNLKKSQEKHAELNKKQISTPKNEKRRVIEKNKSDVKLVESTKLKQEIKTKLPEEKKDDVTLNKFKQSNNCRKRACQNPVQSEDLEPKRKRLEKKNSKTSMIQAKPKTQKNNIKKRSKKDEQLKVDMCGSKENKTASKKLNDTNYAGQLLSVSSNPSISHEKQQDTTSKHRHRHHHHHKHRMRGVAPPKIPVKVDPTISQELERLVENFSRLCSLGKNNKKRKTDVGNFEDQKLKRRIKKDKTLRVVGSNSNEQCLPLKKRHYHIFSSHNPSSETNAVDVHVTEEHVEEAIEATITKYTSEKHATPTEQVTKTGEVPNRGKVKESGEYLRNNLEIKPRKKRKVVRDLRVTVTKLPVSNGNAKSKTDKLDKENNNEKRCKVGKTKKLGKTFHKTVKNLSVTKNEIKSECYSEKEIKDSKISKKKLETNIIEDKNKSMKRKIIPCEIEETKPQHFNTIENEHDQLNELIDVKQKLKNKSDKLVEKEVLQVSSLTSSQETLLIKKKQKRKKAINRTGFPTLKKKKKKTVSQLEEKPVQFLSADQKNQNCSSFARDNKEESSTFSVELKKPLLDISIEKKDKSKKMLVEMKDIIKAAATEARKLRLDSIAEKKDLRCKLTEAKELDPHDAIEKKEIMDSCKTEEVKLNIINKAIKNKSVIRGKKIKTFRNQKDNKKSKSKIFNDSEEKQKKSNTSKKRTTKHVGKEDGKFLSKLPCSQISVDITKSESEAEIDIKVPVNRNSFAMSSDESVKNSLLVCDSTKPCNKSCPVKFEDIQDCRIFDENATLEESLERYNQSQKIVSLTEENVKKFDSAAVNKSIKLELASCLSSNEQRLVNSSSPCSVIINNNSIKVIKSIDEDTESDVVLSSDERDKQANPPVKRKQPRWKKRYLKAGLFSDYYKENEPKKVSSLDSKKMFYDPNLHLHGLLPPPYHCGKYLRQRKIHFQLPYDLWWLHTHSRLPGRDIVPSWNYKKIRCNVYFDVKPTNVYESQACECSGESSCTDDCINRLVFSECSPGLCPCGERCKNQKIQKHEWAPGLQKFMTEKKGWGIRTNSEIKSGEFILEYVGEVVSEREFKNRMATRYINDTHHYCLHLDGGLVIDGHRMGGEGRFVNHSCEPNCEMQKWSVNGLPRMALFASRNINAGEELTYDYNFALYNPSEGQKCRCGSTECRGVIGGKSQRVSKLVVSNAEPRKERRSVGRPRKSDAYQTSKASLLSSRKAASKYGKPFSEFTGHLPAVKSLSHQQRCFVREHRCFLLRNLEKAGKIKLPNKQQVPEKKVLYISKEKDVNEVKNTPEVSLSRLTALSDENSSTVRTRSLAQAQDDPEINKTAKLAKVLKDLYTVIITSKDENGHLLSTSFLKLPLKRKLPDYYEKVQEPIDLATIEQNIDSGHYKTADQFDQDIVKLIENNISYYGRTSETGIFAAKLKKLYSCSKADFIPALVEVTGLPPSQSFLPNKGLSAGEEDIIRCICGLYRDEGVMIQCEKCLVWQHCDCVKADANIESYLCEKCEPRDVSLEITAVGEEEEDGKKYYKTLLRGDLQLRQNDTIYVLRDTPEKHTYRTIENYDYEQMDIFRIERLYKNEKGERYAFGHHYLRPHETYHEPTRKFYNNEILCVPLYEAIPFDLIAARCWVLDPTTFTKGRPVDSCPEHIYICEYRVDKAARMFAKVARSRHQVCMKPYAFEKFPQPIKNYRTYLPHSLEGIIGGEKNTGKPNVNKKNSGVTSAKNESVVNTKKNKEKMGKIQKSRKKDADNSLSCDVSLKKIKKRQQLNGILMRLLDRLPNKHEPLDATSLLERTKRNRKRPGNK